MIAALAAAEDDPSSTEQDDGPTCRLCTGSGHGYPGAGPCPLETATLRHGGYGAGDGEPF